MVFCTGGELLKDTETKCVQKKQECEDLKTTYTESAVKVISIAFEIKQCRVVQHGMR